MKPRSFSKLHSSLIVASLLFAGCSATSIEPKTFYLSGEVDTAEHQALMAYIIELFENGAYPSDHGKIDYWSKNGVQNVLSSSLDKDTLFALIENFPTLPNEDSAAVSTIYTLVDLAIQKPETDIQAVMVTNGTSDKAIINFLLGASQALAEFDNVHLVVLGVAPEHRASFAKGFEPIRDRLLFAGTQEEMPKRVRSIGGN